MFEKIGNPQWRKEKKAELTVGVKKLGKTLVAWAPWVITLTTVYAAWEGCEKSRANEKELKAMKARVDQLEDVVNHNAHIGNMDHKVLVELTKDNEELLNRALRITEGKDSEGKEETAA